MGRQGGAAMSVHARTRPTTVHDISTSKANGEKLAMLTAYDSISAAIAVEAGVDLILVGDSLGMVMLGETSTVPVTVDQMLHHVRAVTRGAPQALVIADLPFGSYQESPEQALHTAIRFLKESAANAVKLEGGGRMIETTARLVDAGIPVMAHLGLTPQSVNALGGYRVQGRTDEGHDRILADAKGLEQAGAFALVLEAVPNNVGTDVTAALSIPTIGIGAGPDTDGQVLVWHDMLGLTDGPQPRFVKRYAELRIAMQQAIAAYVADVKDETYPAPEHTYG
jgi:3-methyl-2-oxobutanoate hydroxymethyltransferase